MEKHNTPLYSLSLDNSDPHKGWLLQLFTEDTKQGHEIAEHFKQVAMQTFRVNKYSKRFLQGETGEWKMFEFWTRNQNEILAFSMLIAKIANLELEIGDDEKRLRSVLEAGY